MIKNSILSTCRPCHRPSARPCLWVRGPGPKWTDMGGARRHGQGLKWTWCINPLHQAATHGLQPLQPPTASTASYRPPLSSGQFTLSVYIQGLSSINIRQNVKIHNCMLAIATIEIKCYSLLGFIYMYSRGITHDEN